jgi:hypothetical protein
MSRKGDNAELPAELARLKADNGTLNALTAELVRLLAENETLNALAAEVERLMGENKKLRATQGRSATAAAPRPTPVAAASALFGSYPTGATLKDKLLLACIHKLKVADPNCASIDLCLGTLAVDVHKYLHATFRIPEQAVVDSVESAAKRCIIIRRSVQVTGGNSMMLYFDSRETQHMIQTALDAHVFRWGDTAATCAKMEISEGDLAKHNQLLKIEGSDENRRTWVPFREIETVFRPSFTTHDGQDWNASDYGHRAFPMEVKGKHLDRRRVPKYALDRTPLEPIRSDRRLPGGYAAGDRVAHGCFGVGVILSISPTATIFQFNSGLKSVPTLSAYQQLRNE